MEMQKLIGLITTILVTVIILAISLVVMQGFSEAQISSESETITLLNGTAVDLSHTGIRASTFSLSNATVTLGSGNYTLAATTGKVTLIDNTYNDSEWTAAYDYGEDLAAYTSTESSIDALADIPTWIPLIIVVVIASILLGLVFGVFSKKGETL